jgi:hypothetical protein
MEKQNLWNLSLVPKILHLYWGGGPMYYLRYMTIKTFMKQNPDWKIMLWYPKYPNTNFTWYSGEQNTGLDCDDFLDEAMDLPIDKVPVDFREYGFHNSMSEVHKSDFIRLRLLSTLGGVWSDMDIFYFKPMNSLYFNTEENKAVETVYCNRIHGHSVGFLMGSENNTFFQKLMELSKKEFNPHLYQAMGSLTYNKYFPTFESINRITPAFNMSMDVVYSHNAGDVPDIINSPQDKFTNESIGLHWYAGSSLWKDFINKTNGGLENLPNTIIGKLLSKYEE